MCGSTIAEKNRMWLTCAAHRGGAAACRWVVCHSRSSSVRATPHLKNRSSKPWRGMLAMGFGLAGAGPHLGGLGHAGRARGEDEERRIGRAAVRAQRRERRRRCVGQCQCLCAHRVACAINAHERARHAAAGLKELGHGGEERCGGGVEEEEADGVLPQRVEQRRASERRVDQRRPNAELGHAEPAEEVLRPVRDEQRDAVARAKAAEQAPVGDPVRLGVDLRVRVPPLAEDERLLRPMRGDRLVPVVRGREAARRALEAGVELPRGRHEAHDEAHVARHAAQQLQPPQREPGGHGEEACRHEHDEQWQQQDNHH
eukprot:7384866-Prymnesium_polylepis.1